jgi:hypothetical protein
LKISAIIVNNYGAKNWQRFTAMYDLQGTDKLNGTVFALPAENGLTKMQIDGASVKFNNQQ